MQRDNFLDDIPVQYNAQSHPEPNKVDFLSDDDNNNKKLAQNDDDEF